MSGVLLYSFFSGRVRKIVVSEGMLQLGQYIHDKKEKMELFFMKFSKIKGAIPVKRFDVKQSYQFIEAKFKYDFKSIQKEEFYKNLSPALQRKIIFQLFGRYRHRFHYFFEDLDFEYKASDYFIAGILSNLECQIFLQES